MAKKEWELSLGERKLDTGNHDEVLSQAVTESRVKRLKMAEELSEAEHKAKMAKLAKEVEQASGSSSTGGKKEPDNPVKFEVKGGVNLGNIDLDEERRRAAEELKLLKKEQDDNIRSLGAQNEDLRDRIHAKEIEILSLRFESQMTLLNKMIEQNASSGDFSKQLAAAKETAALLGFQQPLAGGGGRDMGLEIKLKEIEFNNTIQLKKFEEEAKDRDVQRKIDIQKMEDERQFKRQENERQAKRDEMFASFPEIFGRGIARGLAERAEASASGGSGSPVSRNPQPGIEAGVGEYGEANCANCGTVMAIGSTAAEVVCAKCGARYPIKRVKPTEEQSSSEVAEEEE
jgi:predicted RNA-binding Zn-ribbon protein involved in translation (DUF1610 family)